MGEILGVCIAVGPVWKEAAELSVSRMQEMTGVECVTIGDHWPEGKFHGEVNPSWGKLWLQGIFPNRDLMIFDADIFPAKRWNPARELAGFDFAFAHERQSERLARECQELNLDIQRYGNCGLMLVTAGSQILKRAQKRFPNYGSWLEQSGVNREAQDSGERVKMLPRSFNFLANAHPNTPREQAHCHAVNIHFCNSGRRPGLLPKLHRRMARIIS